MSRFEGKAVVVIGGATGIGAATVRRLVAEGASVLMGDINMTAAEHLAASIKETGGEILVEYTDLSQEDSMRSVMTLAKERLGTIDCLFLNGADVRQQTMDADTDAVSIELALWDRIMAISLRGYMLGVRFAVPIMLENGGGSIVCTSTEYSLNSHGGLFAYGVSKSGINQLVRHVAARWGREGIRCNGVLPGCIQTETMREIITPELEKHFLGAVCSPRLGLPEDIAGEVLHLFSDDALYLNGQCILVNGGSLFR